MDCHGLELPMVLLDPWRILRMVWIKLHVLVKVHILYHLIYSFVNSHSWSCQCIFLDHNCDIADVSVHKASCFQDGLWFDNTTLLWVLSIPLVVLFSNRMDCHLAWYSIIHLQPDQGLTTISFRMLSCSLLKIIVLILFLLDIFYI